jgi:CheY-like chemotaxis protein
LVIDDDEGSRAMLDMALADQGYEVIEAENGAEGLALAHTAQPHVILLDMRMPVMDGWAFAQAYQQQEGRQAALIVFTAAPNAPQRAAEVGADGYLAKPFKVPDLLTCIAEHLTEDSTDEARAASRRRIHWREAGERSYAFDRTTRRVVAACHHGVGTRWWVVLRHRAETHGPFGTLEQARSEAEKYLLA